MPLRYGWEKLHAVYTAMPRADSLQKRLVSAYLYNPIHRGKQDVPLEVWKALKELKKAVTSRPALGSDGSVAASNSVMSDEEAGRWLMEIAGMFSVVMQSYGGEKQKAGQEFYS